MTFRIFRTLSIAALLLTATLAAAPAAHAQLGVAGGANFDRLGDIESDEDTGINFDNATGYHAGIFYEFGAGPLRVRPGVFYMDVGSFENSDSFEQAEDEFDLNLVEVPIDLRFRVFPFPFVKPYATAGPVLRFDVSEDEGFGEATEDFSFAGNVGGGLEISFPGSGLRLTPELRYSFGVTPVADFEALGVDFQAEDNETQLNNIMLRLGISF
jgi:hypothetical protein